MTMEQLPHPLALALLLPIATTTTTTTTIISKGLTYPVMRRKLTLAIIDREIFYILYTFIPSFIIYLEH